MYILYGGKFTRTLGVQMVLEEGGIDYELREIDIVAGEHRSAEYLAINSAGFVPAMITPEGDVLHETPALMLYLVDRHCLTELAPAVDDPDRGRFLSGLFYIADELHAPMKRFNFPHRYAVHRADIPAVRDSAQEVALTRLEVIDRRVADPGPYYLGERFSLIDLYACFWVSTFEREATFARCPAIERLYRRVRDRPKSRALFEEAESMARSVSRPL